jgi:SAM-dependent methyltransferase
MGLLPEAAKFLIHCRHEGDSFKHVLTVGRHNLLIDVNDLQEILSLLWTADAAEAARITKKCHTPYIEPFLHMLGAEKIDSMDANDYEDATIIHDMNYPVTSDLHERFDVVLDLGTIEHIFNFPMAIKNCMEMVRPGGRVIIHNHANNHMGHGFYQFSPELFFRVFSEVNGFKVERMVLHEDLVGQWYDVADPALVRSRVGLVNCSPTYIAVKAVKLKSVPIFEPSFPQQSDYTALWGKGHRDHPQVYTHNLTFLERSKTRVRKLLTTFAPGFTRWLRNTLHKRSLLRNKTTTFRNKTFYTPCDPNRRRTTLG